MNERRLWNIALGLSIVTIVYNVFEGLVSVFFGVSDEALSLFGFGVDSFIEVLSGIGILRMIMKVRKNDYEKDDRFEKTALTVTGISFIVLASGLAVTVAFNLITSQKPETTFWGIVISSVSILTMVVLYIAKLKTGRALKSDAMVSDANCTKTCIYLSLILLASSLLYQFFRIGFIDSIASLGIAAYSAHEGKEALEAAREKGRA